MAGEEDVELRDLVAQTLEAKGVLGKIRAQLRASVFLALEEQESQQRPHPLVSSKLEQFQKTKDGRVVTALVREFLDYFELEYTRSVFDPETNALETYPGRDRLAKDLNLDLQATSSGPLLASVVEQARQIFAPTTSTSRQLKFSDPIPSSLGVSSSAPSQLPTTAGSDTTRTTIVSSSAAANTLYSQATPTLHSTAQINTSTALGTRQESDSQHFSHNFAQSQLNDKHFKQPAIGLNTNENSNSDVGQEARLASQLRSGLSITSGVEGLGLGLAPLHSQGAYAELGETFVNSADSSLDVEKLINTSTESERLRGLLIPSAGGGGGELSRDELDDFFDSSLPSALQDSKDEDQLRDVATAKCKSDELGDKGGHEDDLHNDGVSSHVLEHLDELSLPLETEDKTLSQSSLSGAVDYIEPVLS